MSKGATTNRRDAVALIAASPQTFAPGRDQSFDLGWRFLRGAGALEAASLDDSGWRLLDLPHDWSIEDLPDSVPPNRIGPFDSSAEGGTAAGFTLGGEGWYRKRFRIVDLPEGGRAELKFEGVCMVSEVWLNGRKLGDHHHGYTPFAFDLTPHLVAGGENVVAVRVRNLGLNSRWYSGSGIYRPVRLDVFAAASRIARWGVAAFTRQISGQNAVVEVSTSLLDPASGLRLRTRLKSAAGEVAAEVVSRARTEVHQTLRVRGAKLWSPASPELYVLESEILRGDVVVDRVEQPFGARVVAFEADRGMTINGEAVRLRGGCVHHDNGLLGAAAFADAEERRVLLLKNRGYNAIRSSHYPCSRSFRDACDRHGMLLIEEAFDMWHMPKTPDDYSNYFRANWRADLEAMLRSAWNSPSVIMWSIGNEVPGRSGAEGVQWSWMLANAVHELDSTRPVTAAIHAFAGPPMRASANSARAGRAGLVEPAATLFLDVTGYNYKLNDIEPDHERQPSRVVYASETYAREAFDYEALGARAPYMIGEFVWTSMDYLGEAGIAASARVPKDATPLVRRMQLMGAYPWVVANCGDVDLIGGQKPQSLFRDVVWGVSRLEIAVQRPMSQDLEELVTLWGWSDELPSWSWPGHEGQLVNVRVYTLGDRVELKLNGATVASKSVETTDKACVEFAVSYAAGVLEAVAYRGGAEIARKRLETVGAAAQLRVTAEEQAASRDRQALSFVRVEVLDARGRRLPEAALPLSLRLDGPAELAAFGSANPHALGSFQSNDAMSFRGAALAILRSQGQSGAICVEVRSGRLTPGAATINLT